MKHSRTTFTSSASRGILLFLYLFLWSPLHAQDSAKDLFTLDSVMSRDEQGKTGVLNLSPEERVALEEWLTRFALAVADYSAVSAPMAARSPVGHSGIEKTYRFQSTTSNGEHVQMMDGSLWEVSPVDRINALIWLPVGNVIVTASGNPLYPFRLIRERETVEAKPVTHASALGQIEGEFDLFDSTGSAVAYISVDTNPYLQNEMTLYLWSGTPCAYLLGERFCDDENIYGFNGNHLGWFRNGFVYDHKGCVVAALAENLRGPVKATSAKGLKELKQSQPLVNERMPLKPPFLKTWSKTPATAFFLKGHDPNWPRIFSGE